MINYRVFEKNPHGANPDFGIIHQYWGSYELKKEQKGTDHNVGILVEKFQKLLQAPEAAFKASAK